jgi:hypothetical protein
MVVSDTCALAWARVLDCTLKAVEAKQLERARCAPGYLVAIRISVFADAVDAQRGEGGCEEVYLR